MRRCMRGNVAPADSGLFSAVARPVAASGGRARWSSIGESDTLKCLVPDNWSANFGTVPRLPVPDRVDCCGAICWTEDADVDEIMIAPDYLKRIAAWSRELNEREIEIARAGIVEKSYRANEFIFMRGDQFRILDRRRHRSRADGHRVARRQGRQFCGSHRRRLVRRRHRAQERAAALRRGGAARYAAGDDGPQAPSSGCSRTASASTASWSGSSTSASASSSRCSNMAARWMRPRGWRARSPRCSIRFSIRT